MFIYFIVIANIFFYKSIAWSLLSRIPYSVSVSVIPVPFPDSMFSCCRWKTKTMPSEIGLPTLTSSAFLNQKFNKKETAMNNRRLLIAAVFHFVHPVEKNQLKTSQIVTKLCQLQLSKQTSFKLLYEFSAWTHLSNFDLSGHKNLTWSVTNAWLWWEEWWSICLPCLHF